VYVVVVVVDVVGSKVRLRNGGLRCCLLLVVVVGGGGVVVVVVLVFVVVVVVVVALLFLCVCVHSGFVDLVFARLRSALWPVWLSVLLTPKPQSQKPPEAGDRSANHFLKKGVLVSNDLLVSGQSSVGP